MTLPRPTDAELAILRVLWRQGPCTVRQVFEVLTAERDLGYTTVLKLMQIMTEKGLVLRDDRERSHVFRAAEPAERTREHLVGDLLDKAFEGSAGKLVIQALASRKATREELDEIRRLLDRAEKGEP